MKKLFLFLLLCVGLFGADAANDLLITQRNSGNTGNVQRNIAATTNALLGWNGTSLVNVTAGTNITISAGVISATGGSGTPGGTPGQAQYNNSGSFGGYTVSGDATLNTATGVLTLATVNSTTGAYGSAAQVATFTVNAKGLVTASGNTSIAIPFSAVTQSGATTNQLPAWSGSAWVPTGSPIVNLLTRTGTSTNNAVLGVLSDSTTYNVLTLNNVATMAGTVGMSGGGGSDTNLYLRVPTGGTVLALVNNVVTGGFSATGLNSTRIGITSPLDAIFTTIASNSNANIRTTKGNFNVILNVKDYGALGNGSNNDTTFIAAAFTAAISAHGSVYFPAGTYMTDRIVVTGATGLAVFGDGMGVSVIKTRSPSQVLNASASDHLNVHHLTFDGSCTTRTAGQQAVVFDASYSSFCDNEIINSGEYAFFAGSGSTQITDLIVSRDLVRSCYADGINFQYVTRSLIADNIVDGSDDDCIALGYNGSGVTSFVTVIGNFCKPRNDLGTNWGRGILAENAQDCFITGNYVKATKQTGIFLNGAGGSRAIRIEVKNNFVNGCALVSGHPITAYTTQECTLDNNTVENPVQGNCIEIADWQYLIIRNGILRQDTNTFCRGIHVDEGTSWSTGTWIALEISDVSIQMLGTGTDACVYLNPNAAYSMNTGSVSGIRSGQNAAGNYISISTTTTAGTWKLGNNITLTAGRTVSPSTTTGAVTVFNNN